MNMDTLLTSVSDRGVATVVFNRPDKANSYDHAMLDALGDAFERFGGDPSVRVIVLRGSGKHFSAGAAFGQGDNRPRRGITDVCGIVDAVPKPTIAAVRGACIGGALALASCCDVLLAARDASFAIPEVRLGFAPGPLVACFTRALGYRHLRRYLLSGERLPAEEALRIDLAHQLCDPEALDGALDAIVDGYLLAAPGAVARAKQVLRTYAAPQPSPEELAELQKVFDAIAHADEAAEGRASHAEKRKPAWYPPR